MTAKSKTRRQRTLEKKLKILEQACAPNTTVAEVLRRHQLDATTFYSVSARQTPTCWRRSAIAWAVRGENDMTSVRDPLVRSPDKREVVAVQALPSTTGKLCCQMMAWPIS